MHFVCLGIIKYALLTSFIKELHSLINVNSYSGGPGFESQAQKLLI